MDSKKETITKIGLRIAPELNGKQLQRIWNEAIQPLLNKENKRIIELIREYIFYNHEHIGKDERPYIDSLDLEKYLLKLEKV